MGNPTFLDADPPASAEADRCRTPRRRPRHRLGSDLVIEITVMATFTTINGTTTDCTTPPDACVISAARVDPDATTTVLSAPLLFHLTARMSAGCNRA